MPSEGLHRVGLWGVVVTILAFSPPPSEAEMAQQFEGQVQVNLIVTGLGPATFDDVFSNFSRDERTVPAPIMRKMVKEPVEGESEEEESPQRFEMGRDPLDVPAFMRRRAYANSTFSKYEQ